MRIEYKDVPTDSCSLLQVSKKVHEKRFKIMVTFFSQTFTNVTHLDVSRCNLDSSAAEVCDYIHRLLDLVQDPFTVKTSKE